LADLEKLMKEMREDLDGDFITEVDSLYTGLSRISTSG
jgi:hypothetical protein